MSATYEWNGHAIRVDLLPIGRTACLAMGFVVTVDGRRYMPVPELGLTTQTKFVVGEGESQRDGVVRSTDAISLLPRLGYVVTIGDEMIAEDRQFQQRWYLTCAAWGVLVLVLILVLIAILVAVFALVIKFQGID